MFGNQEYTVSSVNKVKEYPDGDVSLHIKTGLHSIFARVAKSFQLNVGDRIQGVLIDVENSPHYIIEKLKKL